MARTDDVIENPANGLRLIFRKTANTGGELLGHKARPPRKGR